MSTIGFKLVEGIHVSVSSVENVTDAEWDQYIEDIGRTLPDMTGLLSYTEGAAPTSNQRVRIGKFWNAQTKRVPLAIITTSKIVRIIVTAFNWMLGEQIRAFNTIDEGLEYLKLDPMRRQPVVEAVGELLEHVRSSQGR
ncbi:MAG: hypothetical protein R3B70_00615 [Polyangiaceae bacterium]